MTLEPSGEVVRAKLVVDATGFESRMVARESDEASGLWKEAKPGYQIAYGMCIDAKDGKIGPYDPKAMTLFDYRTDHLEGTSLLADAEDRPSFVYTMPTEDDGVFFEETSLVGRDERRLEFETLRQRLLKRLEFHGIKYDESTVREEEYCYIPMGGALPDPSQRLVPFGGAANTVHPATGYQLCRMLASAPLLVDALSAELRRPDFDPDAAAAAGHAALWPRANRLQRDFAVFGGEFLGAQPVEILRGFFGAFFALDQGTWGGFLAGGPAAGEREPRDLPRAHQIWPLDLLQFPAKSGRASASAYLATFSTQCGPRAARSSRRSSRSASAPRSTPLRERREAMRATYCVATSPRSVEAVEMLKPPPSQSPQRRQLAGAARADHREGRGLVPRAVS